MKRTTTKVIATALSFALATGAMVGCGSQQEAAPEGEQEASRTVEEQEAAPEATEQSMEELVAEYKQAVANIPDYQSVTLDVEESSTLVGEESTDNSIVSTTVYKFDKSGDQLKTSAEVELEGVKVSYYTDGDDAVMVTDGPVYSGTAEQFEIETAKGLETFLSSFVGDLNTFADCATKVEKIETSGLRIYMLDLDVQKYTESDETLSLLAESGSPVTEAMITVGFEEDGSLASIDSKLVYADMTALKNIAFVDYNTTVIDPMPEATATFEDMEAKFDEYVEDVESDVTSEADAETTDEATTE